MLNANAAALVAGIDAGLQAASPLPNVTDSREATLASVDLMRKTFANLSPKAIVDAFAAGEDLWEQFGDATIATCVEGARTLAMLWESAWAEGNGGDIATSKLTARDKDALVTLYSDKDFIPSVTLKQLVDGTSDRAREHMLKLLMQFGMTPSSATRVTATVKGEGDPLEAWAAQ